MTGMTSNGWIGCAAKENKSVVDMFRAPTSHVTRCLYREFKH